MESRYSSTNIERMLKMYAGVKHNAPTTDKIYWFDVPRDIQPHVEVGSKVLMDTRMGMKKGTIVELVDEAITDVRSKLSGALFPLKHIKGVHTQVSLDCINIPSEFKESRPSEEKIRKRRTEFTNTLRFKTPVVVKNWTLVDGYTAYLAAKEFGLDRLSVLMVSSHR